MSWWTLASLSALSQSLSILAWLGAQLPQTYTNYVLKSADGLSFPFLVNWLLGDTCNLIGCILTEQLPFQTVLATYFVFIDFSLCGQWLWYRKNDLRVDTGRREIGGTGVGETDPLLESATTQRSHSLAPSARSYSSSRTIQQQHQHYRTIQALASNVAAAASEMSEATAELGEDEGEMIASFYSERSTRSRGKHVSWSQDRLGRDRTQSSRIVHDPQHGNRVGSSSSGPRRPTRSSTATGAGIAFLGLWTFIGIGHRISLPFPSIRAPSSSSVGYVIPTSTPSPSLWHPPSSEQPPLIEPYREPILFSIPTERDGPITPQPPPLNTPPTYQRIIGRISAWICTTLYLTSRMPQIWKNFLRQSTQGLSPWLFLFAFLGNFFYVISIMTSPNFTDSPPLEARAFLMESLPYLLGSGGVLTFDLIILGQWWAFKGRKPRRSSTLSRRRGRRLSSSVVAVDGGHSAGAEGV